MIASTDAAAAMSLPCVSARGAISEASSLVEVKAEPETTPTVRIAATICHVFVFVFIGCLRGEIGSHLSPRLYWSRGSEA
jgi:hypothetical protein